MKSILRTSFTLLLLAHSLVDDKAMAGDEDNCFNCTYDPSSNFMNCGPAASWDKSEKTKCIVAAVDLNCGANRHCQTTTGFRETCESVGACYPGAPAKCHWTTAMEVPGNWKDNHVSATLDQTCRLHVTYADGEKSIFLQDAELPARFTPSTHITPIRNGAHVDNKAGGDRNEHGLGIFY
ncbi:MAG: hypothetical protein H0X26_01995 [Alphaproteobacteria bacterium]|nr:hypothetical protein [Alphaproteobacteria bacterium]